MSAVRVWSCFVVLVVGCATAPSVEREQVAIPAGHGVVLGKFGVPPAMEKGALSRKMQVQRLGSKQSAAIAFREFDSDDDGRSAPFVVQLPAGKYQIAEWELSFADGTLGQDRGQTTFEVVPGQVTCVGGLYPVRGRRGWSSSAHIIALETKLLAQDECAGLYQYLHKTAPRLAGQRQVRLANDPRCPGCKPEETWFLSLVEAEALRTDGAESLPVKWPAAPAWLTEARVQLQVCVTVTGQSEDVVVLKSAHPQLDAQLVAAAQTWQFSPYMRQGKPTPFCYRPEFKLYRP